MKKAVLISSIVLNVLLLILIIIGIRYNRRMAFRTVADATAAEVRLQEHVLKELNSGEVERIEAVKDMLRRNIENGKQAAVIWKAATK